VFKKKKEINPSLSLPPQQMQDEQEQFMQPQQYPPILTQQPEPITQKQQFNTKAIIIEAHILEEGKFRYVIDTNYPLRIGECQLTQ